MSTAGSKKKKVFIVSFNFPPTNSIGAVRVGKFAKYLPEFGWEPIVLTTDSCPPFPQTLMVETDRTNIVRVPRAPKNMDIVNYVKKLPILKAVLPDPITWYWPTLRAGHKIMRQHNIDALFSSYPPSASHFIASHLQRESGIPWLAEFRDPWSHNPYHSHGIISSLMEKETEKRIVQRSSLLISVTEGWTKQLQKMHNKEVAVIHNGFDEEDCSGGMCLTAKFTITYTGNIYPGKRDPSPLFRAVAQLIKEGLISTSNFEMRFFGNNMEKTLSPLVRRYNVQSLVKIQETIPFKESIKRQKESTVLLLLSWNDYRDKDTYTGKIFEYLGAGRPIIAIAYKDGVIDKLLRETKRGIMANDTTAIRDVLLRWLTEWQQSGRIISYWNPEAISINKYTRRERARKLAHLLNAQCSHSNNYSTL